MNVYKILLSVFLFIFIGINNTYSESNGCKYTSEINQCIESNLNGTTNSIEDFVCIVGTNEEVLYQVILDKEFKKIDDEMDEYIEKLEQEKNRYFGTKTTKTYIDGINDIRSKNRYYYKKYNDVCGIEITKQVISCNSNKKAEVKNALNFFSSSTCMGLVETKLEIFDDIAFNILMLNKQQIKKDDKKLYDRGQKSNYNKLIDIMMINLGYIERILQKWPSKILNTLN